jgi:hypothetical protein
MTTLYHGKPLWGIQGSHLWINMTVCRTHGTITMPINDKSHDQETVFNPWSGHDPDPFFYRGLKRPGLKIAEEG